MVGRSITIKTTCPMICVALGDTLWPAFLLSHGLVFVFLWAGASQPAMSGSMDGDTVIGSNNCISNASNGSSNFILIFDSLLATPPLQLNQSLEWVSMCPESSCYFSLGQMLLFF